MSRRALVVRFAGALVGVVAIAFAAASIDDAVEPGGDRGQGGEGESGITIGNEPVEPPRTGAEIPAFLEYLVLLLVAIVTIVVVWYLLTNRRGAVKLLAVGVGILLAATLLYEVLSGMALEVAVPEPETPVNASNETGGGDPGSGDGDADAWPIGTLSMVLAVVAAIAVGALVLSRGGSGGRATSSAEASADRPDETAAVGAAAGRAADRIEATDEEAVDNEVYRAWRDMTDLLEVDRPETSTPREFADAAIESGLDREHVEELTRLFEDVRYGHATTTAERERRAVAVLRRIESAYADGEATPATDGDRQ